MTAVALVLVVLGALVMLGWMAWASWEDGGFVLSIVAGLFMVALVIISIAGLGAA